MFPIRPFTEGYIPIPTAPSPLWTPEARRAAQRAFFRAAQQGKSGEDCGIAYTAAWKAVEDRYA